MKKGASSGDNIGWLAAVMPTCVTYRYIFIAPNPGG